MRNETAHDVDWLRREARGPVILPSDPEYDDERSGFQADEPLLPSVVVGAACPEDVQAAVRYAAGHELPVAVQASGHGLGTRVHGGVLVASRHLRGLSIDTQAQTATIDAGVSWSEVIEAAAPHRLAPVSGSAPGVSAVGYTLGGGLGLLGRCFGWAADHVRSLDVVTADGRLLQVSETRHPDLFWAVRGGGGNFGIVTRMEVELMPLRTVWGGALFFTGEASAAVLDAYLEWTATLPEEMTSSVALLAYPDLPQLPVPLRGRYVISVRLAYAGEPGTGERLLEPMRSVAPPLVDTLRELPWTESHTITSDPPQPHPYTGTSVVLRAPDPDAVRTILTLAGPVAEVPCVVQVNHLGGALGRSPRVPNAVGHRGGTYLVRVLSAIGPSPRAAIEEAHERLVRALGRLSVCRLLPFQFGGRPLAQTRECYEADDFSRLEAIKARHDPQNRFRSNHNIPPRAAERGRETGPV